MYFFEVPNKYGDAYDNSLTVTGLNVTNVQSDNGLPIFEMMKTYYTSFLNTNFESSTYITIDNCSFLDNQDVNSIAVLFNDKTQVENMFLEIAISGTTFSNNSAQSKIY